MSARRPRKPNSVAEFTSVVDKDIKAHHRGSLLGAALIRARACQG